MKKDLMPSDSEMKQLCEICRVLGNTHFYNKLGAGGVLAIWLTARELNLPPMMCLNGGLYNIDGKVTMSSQLMNMMIVNAGHKVNVKVLNDKGCTIEFVRNDRGGKDSSFVYSFTIEDAERAGYFGRKDNNGNILKKPKDNWVSHPKDMFYSRALSGGARKFMPDVLMNSYVFGEIDEVEDQPEQAKVQFEEDKVKVEQEVDSDTPKIEKQKLDSFIEKFKIGTNSQVDKYLCLIADKSKKNKAEIIDRACVEEEAFVRTFNKWLEKTSKKTAE